MSFLRSYNAAINTTNDAIYIQDSRNAVMRYRTAGNLLCASAPLIEQVCRHP